MSSYSRNPIFCAIDTPDLNHARKMAESLRGQVRGFKLGLEFFLNHHNAGYKKISELGVPIFLDLKMHDIPKTVAGAMQAILHLRPAYVTVHASGGAEMLKAAVDATAFAEADEKPKILGVTVLTSLDKADLMAVGQGDDPVQQAVKLSLLCQECGLDGVVCSPLEVKAVRAACGAAFTLMVPGIRPPWTPVDDQKRTMVPREAIAAGANFLVIGRPITDTQDPQETARRIASDIT